jgi:hypothetical protein
MGRGYVQQRVLKQRNALLRSKAVPHIGRQLFRQWKPWLRPQVSPHPTPLHPTPRHLTPPHPTPRFADIILLFPEPKLFIRTQIAPIAFQQRNDGILLHFMSLARYMLTFLLISDVKFPVVLVVLVHLRRLLPFHLLFQKFLNLHRS